MNGKETSTGWEMPFRILSLATAVGCLLSGCASGFAKFYEYVDTLSGVVPYTVANPPVVSTVNTPGTGNTYGSGGYASGNYDSSGTIRVTRLRPPVATAPTTYPILLIAIRPSRVIG